MLDYAAFPEQRQNKIKQLLKVDGRVISTALALEMGVSEHTIRRDLNELSESGMCKRVHGGAVAILKETSSFEQRIEQNQAEKNKIALSCIELIKPNSCIFIDSGSTNLEIARSLPNHLAITAVTNSPLTALALMQKPCCDVILIGGKLNNQIGASIGNYAMHYISQIHFDQCFLGGCALDPQIGITVFDYEEAEFKKAVIAQSNQVIMGSTVDKFPAVARYTVADFNQLTVLVIDSDYVQKVNDLFGNRSVKIIATQNN